MRKVDGTLRIAPDADILLKVHSTLMGPKEMTPTFIRDVGASSVIVLR
jgi:hypothetical protein